MRFRKLRIAWSVGWGLLAVLLIVLWVRSFNTGTTWCIHFTNTQAFKLVSQRGFVGAVLFDPSDEKLRYDKWGLGSHNLDSFAKPSWDIRLHPKPDIYVQAMIPWWTIVLIVAVVSSFPLPIKWRFSLRTLLIATTLVAVLLGAVIYAVR